MIKDSRKNRDLNNLLFVLGSAILCAAMLASIFLYYYGPSGKYIAGKALLDPSTIKQINYLESDPSNRQKVHFIFDQIEFSYFDSQAGKVKKQIVSPENYRKFYELISADKSVAEGLPKIEEQFRRSHPTVLTIQLRTMSGLAHGSTRPFQEIQFAEEDHFRVQLHENMEQGEWIYFTHPHIYQDVIQFFTQSSR